MIFAAGALSFRRPCHRKKKKKKKKRALKTKTDRWGGSHTDILGLSSAPRGTIRSTSAIQSAAWPANRLFSHSHYGIIGVVVAGHQQYVYRSGLQQFNRNSSPKLKTGPRARNLDQLLISSVNILTSQWNEMGRGAIKGKGLWRTGSQLEELQSWTDFVKPVKTLDLSKNVNSWLCSVLHYLHVS